MRRLHLHGLSFLVIRFSKCFHYRQTIRAGMPPRRRGFCEFRPPHARSCRRFGDNARNPWG
ncbi:hypothetical protein L810_8043 [Burkholderia sp. AU4i]|nr:hypothetical protein L810_8043 [Burkholderia sp. AU4i]